MSSDTAKENASVVDSSVTEKHDVGNSDDPGNKDTCSIYLYFLHIIFFLYFLVFVNHLKSFLFLSIRWKFSFNVKELLNLCICLYAEKSLQVLHYKNWNYINIAVKFFTHVCISWTPIKSNKCGLLLHFFVNLFFIQYKYFWLPIKRIKIKGTQINSLCKLLCGNISSSITIYMYSISNTPYCLDCWMHCTNSSVIKILHEFSSY